MPMPEKFSSEKRRWCIPRGASMPLDKFMEAERLVGWVLLTFLFDRVMGF